VSQYIRIKEYTINMQNLAFVRITADCVEFAFAGSAALRFQRGIDLDQGEFEQLSEFLNDLPDPDRVIAV
jgi:hypothetical protein